MLRPLLSGRSLPSARPRRRPAGRAIRGVADGSAYSPARRVRRSCDERCTTSVGPEGATCPLPRHSAPSCSATPTGVSPLRAPRTICSGSTCASGTHTASWWELRALGCLGVPVGDLLQDELASKFGRFRRCRFRFGYRNARPTRLDPRFPRRCPNPRRAPCRARGSLWAGGRGHRNADAQRPRGPSSGWVPGSWLWLQSGRHGDGGLIFVSGDPNDARLEVGLGVL